MTPNQVNSGKEAANGLLEGYDDSKNLENTNTPPLLFSKRSFVGALLFLGCINMYSLRGNASIAVVEMISNKTIMLGNETILLPPEFDWDSKTVGLTISMFSYGYLGSLAGGTLATKFGGAMTYGISLMMAGLLTMLNPVCLNLHFYAFLACRALTGLFDSFAYSCTAEIFSRWAPVKERSTIVSFSLSGIYIGTAITYPFCGFLAHKWGWETVFYATGLICVASSIIWLIFVRNDPSEDKWISKEELQYIKQGKDNTSRKDIVHPYKKILTSKAFWAVALSKLAYSWGYVMVVLCLPLYVKDMTNKTTDEVGLISAIPQVVCILVFPITGTFLDYCQNHSRLKVTLIHKVLTGNAFVFIAILFVITTYATNFVTSIVCFVLVKVLLSVIFLVLQIVSIYMAPPHSCVIAGFSAFWYTVSTIITPTLIGFVVVNHSLEEWSSCFLVSAVVSAFGAIIFTLWGSSEPQSWSLPPADEIQIE